MKLKKLFPNINQKKIWDAENIFYLKSDITRVSKLLYQYEIYKRIIDLPGDIIECGVFKGASLVRFLTFRENLENCYSRKIFGFDAFGNFPKAINDKKSKKLILPFEKGISKNELDLLLQEKHFKNFELIKGDVRKTLPNFLKKNSELKVSLLHLDMDIYEPIKSILITTFPFLNKGAIVIVGILGNPELYGKEVAFNEFLKTIDKSSISIKKKKFIDNDGKEKEVTYFVKN